MEDPISAPEALDREKALVLAAVAARAWCLRTSDDAAPGRQLVASLMEAAAWASRARRHRGLAPMTVADLIEALALPASEWLPGAGDFVLVEENQPTAVCLDFVDDAGGFALEEVEQGIIKTVMSNIGGRPDAAEVYTSFRKFLVEHAWASVADAARLCRTVGVDLARLFSEVPVDARVVVGETEYFFPCLRCGWPMALQGESLSCARSPSCIKAGARYRHLDGKLVALGRLEPPAPVVCSGNAALRPGLWRYTVLPGLEELSLQKRLLAIPEVEVELWPFIDAYDLDVRLRDHRWRVDVKDHVSPMRLARHLAERPAREPTWIVVPDERRDQVSVLARVVPPDARYHFASSTEFVRRVKGES